MNKFLNACKKFLHPWVIVLILVVIGVLIYSVPIIGIASLVAFLPLIGCTIMCGAMVFMMRGEKHNK